MYVPAIAGLFLGALLSQGYEVLVLIPFMALTVLIALMTWCFGSVSLLQATTAAGITIICVQFGYLAGFGVRRMVVLKRAFRAEAGAVVRGRRSPRPEAR